MKFNDNSTFSKTQRQLRVGELLRKEIADISNIDKIIQRTLYIRIQGKEWLPALESLKKKFIQEINSRAGKNLVKNIKFKI